MIILKYHLTEHKELGIPPYTAWERAKVRGDCLIPDWSMIETKYFAFNSLPSEQRKYKKGEGISIHGVKYNYEGNSPEDFAWISLKKGTEIKVKYDSSDIRYVWWWNRNLNAAVQVWASKIRLGSQEFTSDELKKLLPIPLNWYQDMKKLVTVKQGSELFRKLEIHRNQIDNIFYSLKEGLPRNLRERKKIIAKNLETYRIDLEEQKERRNQITGEVVNSTDDLSKIEKHRLLTTSKEDMGLIDNESKPFHDEIFDDDSEDYPTMFKEVKNEFLSTWLYEEEEE